MVLEPILVYPIVYLPTLQKLHALNFYPIMTVYWSEPSYVAKV
jgi:hypothetical protein